MERILLVGGAALLAFAGGISTLAMTRAFGVAFLGAPRDPGVHCDGEVGRSMRIPMIAHAAGAAALGLFPGLGLAVVERPTRLFLELLPGAVPVDVRTLGPAALLGPAARLGLLLVVVLAALLLVRRALAGEAPAPVHVTWGCGYTAPTARIQYTAASYSAQFARIFETVLVHLRRERLPQGPFPERGAHLGTHCVDAVEQRMFEVMGEGDGLVKRVGRRIPIDPRFSLAAGLVVLVAVVGLVISGAGVLR